MPTSDQNIPNFEVQKSPTGLWLCPNCRREMLHFSAPPGDGTNYEAERFLCVTCNSEFRALDCDGSLMFRPVRF